MELFLDHLIAIFSNPYIALIVITALVFDFVNGFHDCANSIATVVGTRTLRPFQAVAWAAWWNFVAAWVFGLAIANTVGKIVDAKFVTPDVIFAGLLGAIAWDLITWWWGLPTSSSHALLGGFGGAAMAYAGKMAGVLHETRFWKTIWFIPIAPLLGLLLGLLLIVAVSWIFRRVSIAKVDRPSRIVQLFSSALYSLGHGTNDAQKTMGIIAALLYASIWQEQQGAFAKGNVEFPFWIVLVCHAAMGLGTLAGGWRIVKTMGMKITHLRPIHGACAETAGAITLFVTSKLGIPVSTTHVITGGIIGVGTAQRLSAVRWGVARRVVWAWVLTIPASGIAGALCYWVITAIRNMN